MSARLAICTAVWVVTAGVVADTAVGKVAQPDGPSLQCELLLDPAEAKRRHIDYIDADCLPAAGTMLCTWTDRDGLLGPFGICQEWQWPAALDTPDPEEDGTGEDEGRESSAPC